MYSSSGPVSLITDGKQTYIALSSRNGGAVFSSGGTKLCPTHPSLIIFHFLSLRKRILKKPEIGGCICQLPFVLYCLSFSFCIAFDFWMSEQVIQWSKHSKLLLRQKSSVNSKMKWYFYRCTPQWWYLVRKGFAEDGIASQKISLFVGRHFG